MKTFSYKNAGWYLDDAGPFASEEEAGLEWRDLPAPDAAEEARRDKQQAEANQRGYSVGWASRWLFEPDGTPVHLAATMTTASGNSN